MKKILFSLMAVLAVAACDKKSDNVMICGDYEISTELSGDVLTAVLNGDEVKLAQVISADGAKYQGVLNDTNVILWNKGQDWMLIFNDDAPIECQE